MFTALKKPRGATPQQRRPAVYDIGERTLTAGHITTLRVLSKYAHGIITLSGLDTAPIKCYNI